MHRHAMDRHHRWTRRSVLRGMSAGAALAPFLPLLDSDSEAQTLPKRFVVMYHGHGWPMYTLRPTGDASGIKDLNMILKPLAPYQQQLVFVGGLDHRTGFEGASANAHAQAQMSVLTCVPDVNKPNGTSIDQLIAANVSSSQKYRSFELGVAPDDANMSSLGPGQGLAAISNPRAAFDRLFKDLAPGNNAAALAALARVRAEDQSVIDFVKGEIGSMRAKLGRADVAKLDGHLAAVRDIEVNLNRPTVAPSATCSAPSVQVGNPADTTAQYNQIAEAQVDILAMALRCDLTRVGSMRWTGFGAGEMPNGVPTSWSFCFFSSPGSASGGHLIAHTAGVERLAGQVGAACNRPSGGPHTQRCTYFAKTMSERLLAKLAEVPEGNGTMLDRTVCMWTSQFSNGGHNTNALPVVLVGGSGLGLQGNRVITFPAGPPAAGDLGSKPSGTSLNDLYVSLANLFGINITSFGKAAYCNGPLPGLLG